MAGDIAGFIIQLKGIKPAEFGQHAQIATRSAACFEKAEAFVLRRKPGNDGFQDLAARAEPPVFALELVEAVIDVSFHDLVLSSCASRPRISRTR